MSLQVIQVFQIEVIVHTLGFGTSPRFIVTCPDKVGDHCLLLGTVAMASRSAWHMLAFLRAEEKPQSPGGCRVLLWHGLPPLPAVSPSKSCYCSSLQF